MNLLAEFPAAFRARIRLLAVDFILVSESEIALNTRAWKLSRSRDAGVGIVITMIIGNIYYW